MTIPSLKGRSLAVRFCFLVFGLLAFSARAHHLYGGYFHYEHQSGYTYEFTIVTYASLYETNGDRDSILFYWGDGTESYVLRQNNAGLGEEIQDGIKKNIYVGSHTYPKKGNFKPYFSDIFRLWDVENIAPGKSGVSHLYFSGIIPVHDTLVSCINNSPIPLTDHSFYAKKGEPWSSVHTYMDPDGDSLNFVIGDCLTKNGAPALEYEQLSDFTIDAQTGVMNWTNPQEGYYCFAYTIEEYRDGKIIAQTPIDFVVFVQLFHEDAGTFSLLSSTHQSYFLTSSSQNDLVVGFNHPDADSVFIRFVNGTDPVYFTALESQNFQGNSAVDTVHLDYFGNDKNQGKHLLTFIGGSVFGLDTTFNHFCIDIGTQSDTIWGCVVEDIDKIVEVAPDIPAFTVAPNLFEETFWVNLGTTYENITLEVFDTRGRLVQKIEASDEQTVQVDLVGRLSGLYLVRLSRNDEYLTVIKAVKR